MYPGTQANITNQPTRHKMDTKKPIVHSNFHEGSVDRGEDGSKRTEGCFETDGSFYRICRINTQRIRNFFSIYSPFQICGFTEDGRAVYILPGVDAVFFSF